MAPPREGITALFPCTDRRPLVTSPFCGLLAPPSLVRKEGDLGDSSSGSKRPRRRRPGKSAEGAWNCWLCHGKNDAASEECRHCSRARVPEWLKLASGGSVHVGAFIRRRQGTVTWYGLVTQIDNRSRQVQAFMKRGKPQAAPATEPSEAQEEDHESGDAATGDSAEAKGDGGDDRPATQVEDTRAQPSAVLESGEPQMVLIVEAELVQGVVTIVWGEECDNSKDVIGPAPSEGDKRLALGLVNYLLCGNCGNLSRLSNGAAVLDSAQVRADKAGRQRDAEAQLAELRAKVKYLNRRWRQRKTGYDDLNAATHDLGEVEKRVNRLRAELAPVQFWCSACAWEWPSDRPFCVPRP